MMYIGNWFTLQPAAKPEAKPAPTPKRPAQPRPRSTPVGTQDSPVLVGQKPDDVRVPVAAQPKKRRALGWWESDWQRVERVREQTTVKREVLAEDLGVQGPKSTVEGMGYTDVIDVNFKQTSIQGHVHQVETSAREGSGLLRRYVEQSHHAFVKPNLPDVALSIEPTVPRNPSDGTQVSPQFAAWGKPTILRTNVYPLVR
jgi:hypothetical protein